VLNLGGDGAVETAEMAKTAESEGLMAKANQSGTKAEAMCAA
jgi:hypothetical protein